MFVQEASFNIEFISFSVLTSNIHIFYFEYIKYKCEGFDDQDQFIIFISFLVPTYHLQKIKENNNLKF